MTEISKPVFSVDESVTTKECAMIMLEKGIGSVAISSEGEVGIVTKTHLLGKLQYSSLRLKQLIL